MSDVLTLKELEHTEGYQSDAAVQTKNVIDDLILKMEFTIVMVVILHYLKAIKNLNLIVDGQVLMMQ